MFEKIQKQISDLKKNYSKIEFYEIEIRLIDIEKEVVVKLNKENLLIKPLVKKFISSIRIFKTKLYELNNKDRFNSLVEMGNKIDLIIDKQIKAEKYHKDLIKKMSEGNTRELSDNDRFYHYLKLKLLKRGYTEEEIEELFRCTIL